MLSCSIDLHLPGCRSLKEKRGALKPIVEGLRRRHEVAVAEVDHQNTWQRASIGIAAVSGTVGHVTEIVDAAERFVWSFTEVEVVDVQRDWLEIER